MRVGVLLSLFCMVLAVLHPQQAGASDCKYSVQLMFVVDASESFRQHMSTITDKMAEIAKIIGERYPWSEVSLSTFIDYPWYKLHENSEKRLPDGRWSRAYCFKNDVPFTTDADVIRKGGKNIVIGWGAEREEAQLPALLEAAGGDYFSAHRTLPQEIIDVKVVVLLTDYTYKTSWKGKGLHGFIRPNIKTRKNDGDGHVECTEDMMELPPTFEQLRKVYSETKTLLVVLLTDNAHRRAYMKLGNAIAAPHFLFDNVAKDSHDLVERMSEVFPRMDDHVCKSPDLMAIKASATTTTTTTSTVTTTTTTTTTIPPPVGTIVGALAGGIALLTVSALGAVGFVKVARNRQAASAADEVILDSEAPMNERDHQQFLDESDFI